MVAEMIMGMRGGLLLGQSRTGRIEGALLAVNEVEVAVIAK